ncbi:MAG: aminotransferase class I/II-fold pyridoxal phosphate-dependent enzyme [Pseudomonadota bacterium]
MNAPVKWLRRSGPRLPGFLADRIAVPFNWQTGEHRIAAVLGDDVPPPDAVMMQSNDYLSLARDPRIGLAKSRALLRQGHGDAVSRVFTHGRDDAHHRFERRMADLLGTESAVLCMSGYSANVGLIQTFAGPETPVYIDKMAHASLWEGILSSGATPTVFAHNDTTDLQTKIAAGGPGLILVDALYSQNGSLCPLRAMVEIAEATGCALVVDETHSFGCHGVDGAGLCVALGLAERVHFRTIGLSKAMTARGGIVAGPREAMTFLRYEARPMIFSTSVLGYEVAGFEAVLDILRDDPWRRFRLAENHRALRIGLAKLGYDVSRSDSQIISILIGSDDDTVAFRRALVAAGVVGSVFCSPAVPKDQAIIRLTVNAGMDTEDIDKVLSAFEALKDMPRRKDERSEYAQLTS